MVILQLMPLGALQVLCTPEKRRKDDLKGNTAGVKKNKPLWKQGPQPKLTAYEKIDYLHYL